MECKVCFDKYNEFNRRPLVLMPCCHTFCLSCVIKLYSDNYYDSLNSCPNCREEIQSLKPNYSLIELMKPDSKFKPQYSRTESKHPDFFYSENHDHMFKRIEAKERWTCDGRRILGECKSKASLSEESICYMCTLCNVLMCQDCLDEPKIAQEIVFRSENHKHAMIKTESDNDNWVCSGLILFNKCKSGLDEYGMSYGKTRYSCRECNDYNLCQECLQAPKLAYDSIDKFKINESLELDSLFSDQTLNMTVN